MIGIDIYGSPKHWRRFDNKFIAKRPLENIMAFTKNNDIYFASVLFSENNYYGRIYKISFSFETLYY